MKSRLLFALIITSLSSGSFSGNLFAALDHPEPKPLERLSGELMTLRTSMFELQQTSKGLSDKLGLLSEKLKESKISTATTTASGNPRKIPSFFSRHKGKIATTAGTLALIGLLYYYKNFYDPNSSLPNQGWEFTTGTSYFSSQTPFPDLRFIGPEEKPSHWGEDVTTGFGPEEKPLHWGKDVLIDSTPFTWTRFWFGDWTKK